VAALLPVNANEADLAAQCIAARAQAEEMLRLVRQNADDIGLVMRLNAQYGSMVRTSLSVHGRLMRVQALRHKREAIDGAATEDARALHVAERSMLEVLAADAALQAAMPEATPVALPGGAPAAGVDHRIAESVPKYGTNPRDAAFETLLSEQPRDQSRGPGEVDLYQAVREAIAKSRLARSRLANSPLGDRELPANGRESPGMAA
jgi:hypothetical protein